MESNRKLSYQEYKEILESLVDHHGVFYQFWQISTPYFSDKIETACVGFNKVGNCIEFLINKNFWDSQSVHNKKFIIAHECLHVINSHGKRSKEKRPDIINQVMDITVNEALVKYFKFNRNEIDPNSEYCWMDTIFKDKAIEPFHNFEYYYNKIEENPDSLTNKKLITSHDGLSSIPQEIINKILSNLSEDDVESLKNIHVDSNKNSFKSDENNKTAGTGEGGLVKNLQNISYKPKKKWESVIKKFERRISRSEVVESHWLLKDRRVFNLNSNLFLPSEVEFNVRKAKNNKIATWFFMDSSGSCWHLADRFFKAAKSLNPDVFDVRYFSFDTRVYDLNINNHKVFGGGGTTFSCVSDFIYKKHKANPYVWILTDGYGNTPSIPQSQMRKWTWFMTEDNSTECIPKESKIYFLADFE